MLFNSWGYLLFLALAVPIHWILPSRYRIGLLGLASVLFYSMWRWEFSLLVIFSAAVDYVAAQRVSTHSGRQKKLWLGISLCVNLGLLVFFKYTYFIVDNIRFFTSMGSQSAGGLDSIGLKIILPLGISFYTFQTISYTIDVYRGIIKPTRNFMCFLTYVAFWPQLIAGPVLRASEVIPQLLAERKPSAEDFSWGMRRILTGLFKKVVIADNLAPLVDFAFAADPAVLTSYDILAAAFLFGFQIYCDFAGYSDIALGSARLLSIRFPENFNWPYLATSPKAFWKRWHISLSSWIRDYLYLPLAGEKFQTHSVGGIAVASDRSERKRTKALLLTWFIMGLWHGAGWNFAIWGLYHASLIYLYRNFQPLDSLGKRFPSAAWFIMLVLIMAGWIPFRSESVSQTLTLFAGLINFENYNPGARVLRGHYHLIAFSLVAGMMLVHHFRKLLQNEGVFRKTVMRFQFAYTMTLVFFILVYLRPVRQFIYFQF